MYSYFTHSECPECAQQYPPDQIAGVCVCGSPLLARYDLEAAKSSVRPADLIGRTPSLWRYHELLPVLSPENVVTLGEGMTPLLSMPQIGMKMGVPGLMMKDEGILPTGSFKARGAALGVSKAKELGVGRIAMPTNGNAGAAWALYAARAGLRSVIAMPLHAPAICRAEVAVSGAELVLVDGHIGQCGAMINASIKGLDIQEVSTLREPFRIEGKKTMGLEIAEQLGWKLPDVIVYPTGGGVGLIGIHKAYQELLQLGWISGPLPRLVAAQSTGCAPVVEAFASGADSCRAWPDPYTIAYGINVPKPLGDKLILRALQETNGCAVAIDDETTRCVQARLAATEGAFVCPEGAAAFAAVERLRRDGWIDESETVVVLNTGAGNKYPETIAIDAPTLKPDQLIPLTRC